MGYTTSTETQRRWEGASDPRSAAARSAAGTTAQAAKKIVARQPLLEIMSLMLPLLLAASAPVHPTPAWQPTYNMSLSTAFMPCNYSGMFDGQLAGQWGLAGALLAVLTYAAAHAALPPVQCRC